MKLMKDKNGKPFPEFEVKDIFQKIICAVY